MEKVIFFVILFIYILVGAIISKFIKNSKDFYIMGERGSTILIVGTLAATYLSATTLMGIAGQSYAEGPLVIAALGSFGAWIGTLLAVIYIGRRMKAYGTVTMPDYFENRFNSKWVSAIAIIIMIVGLIGYGVVQFIGAGLILSEILNIPFPIVILLFTLALLVFSAFGGMFGVVVTDTLMFFTMLAIAIIIAPMIIGQAGLENMKNLSDVIPGYWTISGGEGRSIGWSISQFLVWVLFFTCMPALVSRVFPAKNDFVILKTAIIGVFFAPLMQLMVFLAAGGMQVLQPGVSDSDNAMVIGILDYTPSAIAGLGLAGLMASILSTASTLFVLVGFSLSRDLYEKLFDKKVTEKASVRNGRIAQVIVAVGVGIIAVSRPEAVYFISIYAGSFFAVGWLPTIVASFEWKRMNSQAALASMIIGTGSFILFGELDRAGWLTLPEQIDELMIALFFSVASLLITALITRPSKQELDYFTFMKKTSMSNITIEETLKKPNPLKIFKKQQRLIITYAVITIAVSILVWGFFFVKLGII